MPDIGLGLGSSVVNLQTKHWLGEHIVNRQTKILSEVCLGWGDGKWNWTHTHSHRVQALGMEFQSEERGAVRTTHLWFLSLTRTTPEVWNSCRSTELLTRLKMENQKPADSSWETKQFTWLSGLSAGLRSKGLLIWFPVRARAWVAGQGPSWVPMRGNHTLTCLLFLPHFPSL